MARHAVVFVTDEKYAGFAATACGSMLENCPASGDLDVHLLHDHLHPETRGRLRRVIENRGGSAHFHDVRARLDGDRAYQGRTAHFFRLLAPELLPAQVRRFLYLDCDLIVRGDVRNLAELPLDGNVAAACQDYLGLVRDAVSNHDALGMAGDAPYFNSGVMVIDRETWLSERVSERVLDCTQANETHLYSQGVFFQYDQYALNVVLHGRIKLVGRSWNYGSEYQFREADIIHFNGHGKPWSSTCRAEFRQEFDGYLERAGWQPHELPGFAEQGA